MSSIELNPHRTNALQNQIQDTNPAELQYMNNQNTDDAYFSLSFPFPFLYFVLCRIFGAVFR
jgi:hypothetical protein